MAELDLSLVPEWLQTPATTNGFAVQPHRILVTQPFTGETSAWAVMRPQVSTGKMGMAFWVQFVNGEAFYGSPYPWLVKVSDSADLEEIAGLLMTAKSKTADTIENLCHQGKLQNMYKIWSDWAHAHYLIAAQSGIQIQSEDDCQKVREWALTSSSELQLSVNSSGLVILTLRTASARIHLGRQFRLLAGKHPVLFSKDSPEDAIIDILREICASTNSLVLDSFQRQVSLVYQ